MCCIIKKRSVCYTSTDVYLLQAAMRLSQHIAYAGNSTQSNGSHQAMDEEREARRESPRQHRVRPPGDIEKQKEEKKQARIERGRI